jgi:hypothetical protein
MITRGNQQELKFDPGTFSIDLDGYPFDANVNPNSFFRIHFFLFTHRIGNMNIIVEYMIYIQVSQ